MYKNVLNIENFIAILVVFVASLSFGPVNGQKLSLGAKGGPLTTWAGFGNKEDKDVFNRRLKTGYTANFFIDFPLKENYDLVLEGGVSQRGRRLVFNRKEWENNHTYHFLDMAMMFRRSFRFHLIDNVPAQWFVNIGPEINYWASAKGDMIVGGVNNPYRVLFNEEGTIFDYELRNINRWLFSLGVGVGFKAPLGRRQNIITELRFVSGHTFLGQENSSKLNGVIVGDGAFMDTMKTNLKTLSLTVGYSYDFDLHDSKKGKSTVKKRMKKSR